MDTRVIIVIPRDSTVQLCEEMNVTVVEGAPDSPLAGIYFRLAEIIAGSEAAFDDDLPVLLSEKI
ncbi:MAG: hypothetical protein ACUVSK_07680 [Desulfotomaculales bacterium]